MFCFLDSPAHEIEKWVSKKERNKGESESELTKLQSMKVKLLKLHCLKKRALLSVPGR